jgi:SAM-dependent methyltransferase
MDRATRTSVIATLRSAAAALVRAEEEFDRDAVEIANRTSRSRGAVGAKAVTPRVVRNLVGKHRKILDFGAGKDAAHAEALRADGYDVTAHEFGANVREGLHDPQALRHGPYDVAYASNVLNVQSSEAMLLKTLQQIHRALRNGGVFIGNFPGSPRKIAGFTSSDMAIAIEAVFGNAPMYVPNVSARPKAIGPKGPPKTPVFFVSK